MKKFVLALLFASTSTYAAPFLYSDADPTGAADACVFQEGSAAAVSTPLVNGGCKVDLAAVVSGPHTWSVWFASSLWGTASAKANFTYTKPSAGGTAPALLRIDK